MKRIPQTFIDDLLNRLDIVEVVDHRVKLKKAGKNYSACCPFHDEKTPSFTVSPDKQFYYCFGCGASGNAIGFLMEYERLSFVESVENLARVAGLEVPREESEHSREYQHRQKNLYDILLKASQFYQAQLKEHRLREKAVRYLQNRGLSGHIARDFSLGYAPPGWDNLLVKYGLSEQDIALLVNSGLVIRREEDDKLYDRFRHRIMFPILDNRGRVIGFGGRVLDDSKPKYLNSPETDVFHKGRELYGLYQARQANRSLEQILVVEGYMDVIALAQYGITNAVATLGTACGEEHLSLAFKHTQQMVFCFDGDNAGRSAAKRALMNSLSSMEDGRQIRFLFLPEGQDPDSLVRQIGAERFMAQVQNATPLEDFLFDVAAEGLNIQSMDGRARFSKVAAPLLAQLPPGVYRELMFTNLAKRTGLGTAALMELTREKPSLANMATEPAAPQEFVPPADDVPEHSASHFQHYHEAAHFQAEALPDEQDIQVFRKRTNINVDPVKAATLLLLDNPQLLQEVETRPEAAHSEDANLLRLLNLIDYLGRRPDASFSTLLGFWGGAYGIDSQQELAKMLATHELTRDPKVAASHPALVLAHAFEKINRSQHKLSHQQELSALKAKGLGMLNDQEKNRFRELVQLIQGQAKQ